MEGDYERSLEIGPFLPEKIGPIGLGSYLKTQKDDDTIVFHVFSTHDRHGGRF